MNTELQSAPGSVEDSRQKLARDLKAVADDAEGILRGAAGSAAGELAAARGAVTQQARRSADCTDAYVRANPWRVIGVAAAAGLVAGLLFSRR